MSLPGTCPSCGYHGEIEAFLIEPDAKRAVARAAALDAAVGRALPAYLRLFVPGKRGLRLNRAVRLIDELAAMVDTGTVCKDERVGVYRPATPAMWAAGMEHMLVNPPRGLPLENHNYLRTVVFGYADDADAAAERQREADTKAAGARRVSTPVPVAVAPRPMPAAPVSDGPRKIPDAFRAIGERLGIKPGAGADQT